MASEKGGSLAKEEGEGTASTTPFGRSLTLDQPLRPHESGDEGQRQEGGAFAHHAE